ncbi:O-acetylhomoserine (thiol)-lyase [Smittium mucronatum]|uniref:O-acetylhomoserine (Thiol)-lyase n=1 Tax=Smittium mucronatum TaxID=133383 RepID=A0A1R0H6B5_9FUNG|nr:O-acetylhomoserine (thiol)-lyase [Smittium mucronatum]
MESKKSNPIYEFETLQIHSGYVVDPTTKSSSVPISVTASYVVDNKEDADNIYSFRKSGFLYSRTSNPTVEVLEKRVSALEGGVGGVAFSSGTAAIFSTILNIARCGDNIISTSFLYGGTFNMFNVTLRDIGIEVRFVDSDKAEDLSSKFDDKTKGIFIESIGNPVFNVPDIPKISKLAHDFGIPLIVDNTFGMGGYICRPILHGADIVIHSITKWVGGHGLAIGGIVVDGGSFPWNNGKFPLFTENSKSYKDLVFMENFKLPQQNLNSAFSSKLRYDIVRNVGGYLNAIDAWMFLIGLETLSLRAEKQCKSSMKLAKWLQNHPKIAWVSYPGLPNHKYYEIAGIILRNGYGGVLSFGIKGDIKNATKFCYNLKLISNLANVGDAKTLVTHPWTTTHRQLSDKQKKSSGISPNLIRLSMGIESINDIISDIMDSLEEIKM